MLCYVCVMYKRNVFKKYKKFIEHNNYYFLLRQKPVTAGSPAAPHPTCVVWAPALSKSEDDDGVRNVYVILLEKIFFFVAQQLRGQGDGSGVLLF